MAILFKKKIGLEYHTKVQTPLLIQKSKEIKKLQA